MHQLYAPAAKILSDLAMRRGPLYTLAERHDMLSHARHYALLCKDSGNELMGEMIFRLGDRLDLCRVQMDILGQLTRRLEAARDDPDADEDAMRDLGEVCIGLNEELHDIDHLYTNCASRLGLWEICLQILQVEGVPRDRAPIIGSLWRNIIRTEIKEHRTNWHVHVKATVHRLHHQYHGDPLMFPLGLVVEILENVHFQITATGRARPAEDRSPDREPAQSDFVVACLLEAGASAAELTRAYETVVKSDTVSSDEKVGLCWSVRHLLAGLLQRDQAAFRAGGAAHRTPDGFSLISACLNELVALHLHDPPSLVYSRLVDIKKTYYHQGAIQPY